MDVGNESLPSEVLDCIFVHCERIFMKRKQSAPIFAPKSRLHPLLFVCRKWHDIAERRLYTSVSLGSNKHVVDWDGSRLHVHGREKCKRFLETVQNNPRLASLVRELHLATFKLHPEETKDHIRLIKICKNVEVVQLRGCAHGFEKRLKAALAEVNLVSFKFSFHSLHEFFNGADVFTTLELLNAIQRWPRLESLEACLLGKDRYWESSPSPSLLPTAQCPTLREVSIDRVRLRPTHLNFLERIAPKLERLSLTAGTDCNEVLQRCLQGWSSTLKSLVISSPLLPLNDINRNWRTACPIICSPLIALRELSVSLAMLPPGTLVYLPNLEKLAYTGEYTNGIQLARIIRDGKLPRLCDLRVGFVHSLDATPSTSSDTAPNDVAQELRKACGPKNITLRDVWTTVRELGDDNGVGYDETESPRSTDSDWRDLTPEELQEDWFSSSSGMTDPKTDDDDSWNSD